MPNNDSKADDAECSKNSERSAHKAGITPGDQGIMYQKRWTLYLALKAFTERKQFKLSFELPVSVAGLYDDICLEIDGDRYFIQVKHCGAGKVIKEKFFPKKVKDEKGGFVLAKYNKSLPKELVDGENSNLYCILLTNAVLGEDCKDLFNESDDVQLKIDDWAKGKILCLNTTVSGVETFDEKFVNHFLLVSEQPSLPKLAETIKGLLRQKFSENVVEYVFYMLEYEITRLIHEESNLTAPKTNQWLEKLFETFHEQNCFNFFNYTLEDISQNYSNIKLKFRTELPDGKVAVLPYHQSYVLRMIQAKQMVGEDDYWFIPLESLDQKPNSLKKGVLKALKECQSNRVLILLDNGEKKCLVDDILADRAAVIKKVVVITNREVSELEGHLDWDVQEIAKEISLEDLEGSDFFSYEVSFQGQMVKLGELPCYEAFKSELSGDSLITLIRDKTLSIGSIGLSDETSIGHYTPRRLAEIRFEINVAELAGRTIITDQDIPYSEKEIFACASIENNIKQENLKRPVHILHPIAASTWRWCKSVPNTVRTIQTAIEDFNEQGDILGDDFKAEDAISARIDTFLKPIVELVRLNPGPLEDAINEERFVEMLNEKDHEQMVIIGGETGAGKSTTMRRLAELHKEKCPQKWVVFVNLCGHKLVESGDESAEIDTEWIKQFLLMKITGEDRSFVGRYFSKCLFSEVVVYIDSFDEVCKKYIEKAFKIVLKLIELNVHRIVISSRQYQEFLLFNQWPNTKIFHLIPLSFKDQLGMLREILKCEGRALSDETIQILWNLQGQLSQHVADSSSTVMLGSSLVIHMLAQLVSDPLSGSNLTLSEQFTIFDLFKRYVECFIRRAGEQKLGVDSTTNYFHGDNKGRRRNVYKLLGYNALKKKLSKEGIKVFFKPTEREELDQLQVGSSQINGLAYPNLKHRSFEEFFFACAMQDAYYNSQNLDQFWSHFKRFFNEENRLVRVFFFHRLANRFVRVNNIVRFSQRYTPRGISKHTTNIVVSDFGHF